MWFLLVRLAHHTQIRIQRDFATVIQWCTHSPVSNSSKLFTVIHRVLIEMKVHLNLKEFLLNWEYLKRYEGTVCECEPQQLKVTLQTLHNVMQKPFKTLWDNCSWQKYSINLWCEPRITSLSRSYQVSLGSNSCPPTAPSLPTLGHQAFAGKFSAVCALNRPYQEQTILKGVSSRETKRNDTFFCFILNSLDNKKTF